MHARVTREVRCSLVAVRQLSSTASFPGEGVAPNPSGQVALLSWLNSNFLKYFVSFFRSQACTLRSRILSTGSPLSCNDIPTELRFETIF
jgi:hypothetical protein